MGEHVISHLVAKWFLCTGVVCIVVASNSAKASGDIKSGPSIDKEFIVFSSKIMGCYNSN
jgi:hypothetical protein